MSDLRQIGNLNSTVNCQPKMFPESQKTSPSVLAVLAGFTDSAGQFGVVNITWSQPPLTPP